MHLKLLTSTGFLALVNLSVALTIGQPIETPSQPTMPNISEKGKQTSVSLEQNDNAECYLRVENFMAQTFHSGFVGKYNPETGDCEPFEKDAVVSTTNAIDNGAKIDFYWKDGNWKDGKDKPVDLRTASTMVYTSSDGGLSAQAKNIGFDKDDKILFRPDQGAVYQPSDSTWKHETSINYS